MALDLVLCLFLTFLSVVALANAQQPTKQGISQELFDRFSFFAQYAAGCRDGLDCVPDNCPNVINANTTTIAQFNSTSLDKQGVSGFVLLDHTNQLIVLQFGGTNSCPKVDIDADFTPLDVPQLGTVPCPGCQAHQGFWTAWTNTKNVTLSPVSKAMAQYSDYEVVFVGHSLGAALATVAAAEFRTHGHNVTLYSYASPSVGNYELSEIISNQTNGKTYRLTHSDDLIPRVLYDAARLRIIPEYSQLSPEYWINAPSNITPNARSIQEFYGINNTGGNLHYGLHNKPERDAHIWYIQRMIVCPTGPKFDFLACCNITTQPKTQELCNLISHKL